MMGWRGGFTLEIRSLQTKFLIGTLLVLVLIMTGFIAVVEQRQRSATVDEVQRRGEVLARSLAATSTGALLLYNFTALEQNVGQVAGDDQHVHVAERPRFTAIALHPRTDCSRTSRGIAPGAWLADGWPQWGTVAARASISASSSSRRRGRISS